MKVLEKGITPDGTAIQIEEWNENYSFMTYGSMIGAYPLSKVNCRGSFSPKRNETFRCEFEFNSYDVAKEAFKRLINGDKSLKDYEKEYLGKDEYWECI